MRISERLALAMDPSLMFLRCVGAPPDPWQAKLLAAMARAANDKAVTPRRFHVACSRQSGKSRTVSVAATWVGAFSALAGRPIVIVSASERQANNLANLVRQNLRSLGDDPSLQVRRENGKMSLKQSANENSLSMRPIKAIVSRRSGSIATLT